MIKKIIAISICITCLVGMCSCARYDEGNINYSSEYADLYVLDDYNGEGMILADRDTGVLYLWYTDPTIYGQTLTPLYYADGTLKNIADFK